MLLGQSKGLVIDRRRYRFTEEGDSIQKWPWLSDLEPVFGWFIFALGLCGKNNLAFISCFIGIVDYTGLFSSLLASQI